MYILLLIEGKYYEILNLKKRNKGVVFIYLFFELQSLLPTSIEWRVLLRFLMEHMRVRAY